MSCETMEHHQENGEENVHECDEKSRKTSMPEVFLENGHIEDNHNKFYLGEEPLSPISKMAHLSVETSSSTEELPSPRSRTGSFFSTEDETDCDAAEQQRTLGRRRSSTWDFKMRRNSVKEKERKKLVSEGDPVPDASATMHKSKSDTSHGSSLKRGVVKRWKSFKSRRNSTSTNLCDVGSEDNLTEAVYDYPRAFIGFFVLFVNFASDLEGYQKDSADLKQYFGNQLGYNIREFVDCTSKEMFGAIEKTKREIQAIASQTQQRVQLIVSLLSHGEVRGIHTSHDKRGYFKETVGETNEYMVTSLEDIISQFKHDDDFTACKGMPKIFFVQACHGEEIVKAAGSSHAHVLRPSKSLDREENLNYNPTIPVDADLLVLFAATKFNKAFVPSQSGSWLIQTVLEVFEKLGKDKDIETMLKVVTNAVSHKRGRTMGEDDKLEIAVQVPFRQTSLRGNCYLHSK